jgi:hypothetical protein
VRVRSLPRSAPTLPIRIRLFDLRAGRLCEIPTAASVAESHREVVGALAQDGRISPEPRGTNQVGMDIALGGPVGSSSLASARRAAWRPSSIAS